MNSSPSPEISKTSSSQRYEGLDAFRGFATFGVVWLHTFIAGTANLSNPNELNSYSIAWLRLRDFSLPLIVMSSFFVLTLSTLRNPESRFSSFFATRFKRLWLPLFIWTSVYLLLWTFVMPRVFEQRSFEQVHSIDVYISGYMHLWFLQFIFLGSLIVYPALCRLRSKSESEKIKISIVLFLAAIIYAILLKLFIHNAIQHVLLLSNPSPSVLLFAAQASKYAFFVPVAIGVGLLGAKLNNLYKQNVFRVYSLAAVLLSLIFHLTLKQNALTAPLFGIAVFVAALQPWKRIPFRLVYISAAYSYGIYIFHFLLCELLQILILQGQFKFNNAAIFSISILFYVMSFGLAVLVRKIIPVDWLVPLIPVGLKTSVKSRNP